MKRGLLCCVLWLVALAGLSGCVTVNQHSAVRLSQQAVQSTRRLSASLDELRSGLGAYVDSQTLSVPLLGTAPLSHDTLCQIESVQQSLRLRKALLVRLGRAYEHYILLAQEGADRWSGEVFDNLLVDLDPSEFALAAPLEPGCPPLPSAAIPKPSDPLPAQAPRKKLSPSQQLQRASERLRGLLGQVLELVESEKPLYLSMQKQQLRARASVAKVLYQRHGVLLPTELLGPVLSGLGLSYGELEWQPQKTRGLPEADQKNLRAAVVQLLSRRVEQQSALYAAQLDEQLLFLHALVLQHQRLEAGQPLDFRQLAQWLIPSR